MKRPAMSAKSSVVGGKSGFRFATAPLTTALIVAVLQSPAQAQQWPEDLAWRPLLCGRLLAFDPVDDAAELGAVDHRDVVGNQAAPALFIASDATHLFLRMRLQRGPRVAEPEDPQLPELLPYAWAAQIDTDGDRRNHELWIGVDTIADEPAVRILRNTDRRNYDREDPAEEEVAAYPLASHHRVTEARMPLGSVFKGDSDFFIDWAVHYDELRLVDVTRRTELSLWMGGSTEPDRLDADLACWGQREGEGAMAGGSPGPTVRTRPDGEPVEDEDRDGLSNSEEETVGTQADNPDTDGDGFSDGDEIDRASNPLDAGSTPENSSAEIRGGGGLAGCSAGHPMHTPAPAAMLVALALHWRRRVAHKQGAPPPY